MSESILPKAPFDKIALSCSGGGYRAATFHLGTMAYLNRLQFEGKPLLEKVTFISTVSGGTITGAVYALKKQENATFEEFYQFLFDKISHLDLVKMGLVALNPDHEFKNKFKRKNLINAFATLYDEHFTAGATFKAFNPMKSHLDAVVFNSTEFNNGINFRFRSKGYGYFGNKEIEVPDVAGEEVKVADAMASSACFPGGFEPMMWPNDFIHDDSPNLKLLKGQQPSMGIMDGGIYDNQGIDSILGYRKLRDAPTPYFDLVIISDVASPYMTPYAFTNDEPKKGWRSLNLQQAFRWFTKRYTWLLWLLPILMIVFAILPSAWKYENNIYTGLSMATSGFIFLTWLLIRYLASKVKAIPGKLLNYISRHLPPFYNEKLANLHFEQLSLRRIEVLLLDRINSLITLLSSVFLKVVRRLNFYKLYDDPKYGYRRITTLIKELTPEDFNAKQKEKKRPEQSILKGEFSEVVSDELARVTKEASEVGTTLWFTPEQLLDDMLRKLIASGEITMCYNMIEYLESLLYTPGNGYESLLQEKRTQIELLYDQCLVDWKAFNTDPLFLVRQK